MHAHGSERILIGELASSERVDASSNEGAMRILLLLAVVGLCACTSNVESGRSENEVVTRKSTLMKGQTGAQNGDSDYCNNSSQLCNAGEGD